MSDAAFKYTVGVSFGHQFVDEYQEGGVCTCCGVTEKQLDERSVGTLCDKSVPYLAVVRQYETATHPDFTAEEMARLMRLKLGDAKTTAETQNRIDIERRVRAWHARKQAIADAEAREAEKDTAS